MTNAMAMFQWHVWAEKQEETIVRVNSRVGENAVHYGVVIYKQKTFAIGKNKFRIRREPTNSLYNIN